MLVKYLQNASKVLSEYWWITSKMIVNGSANDILVNPSIKFLISPSKSLVKY